MEVVAMEWADQETPCLEIALGSLLLRIQLPVTTAEVEDFGQLTYTLQDCPQTGDMPGNFHWYFTSLYYAACT